MSIALSILFGLIAIFTIVLAGVHIGKGGVYAHNGNLAGVVWQVGMVVFFVWASIGWLKLAGQVLQ